MRTTAALLVLAACSHAQPEPPPDKLPSQLRVCADPNNLPFSNHDARGFENAIETLIAHDLGIPVAYTWMPQRRGFIRNTLKANACDVVMGEPVGFDMTRVTQPYYRSSYVFVTRADRHLGDL